MIDNIVTILSVIAVSGIAFFLGNLLKPKKSEQKAKSPPKNKASDLARGAMQQTFEDEVSEIDKDLKSNAAAQKLAARANARKRRK